MPRIRFTKEGYEKLKKDYEELLKQRPAAVLDLKTAREMGDLSENGYYKASRAKLSFIDGQLRRSSWNLKHALIIEETSGNGVGIGKKVTLTTGEKDVTYHIVGDLEADPSQGKISLLSPLGKALTNKQLGEEVLLETPARKIIYTITKIA